jgi:mannose-6-phosphate isomerase-like protein (cupin superfamily)
MLKPGDRLNLSPIGAEFRILKTADDTNRDPLEMEWTLAPKAHGTPEHIHPHATESYHVLEGKLDYQVNGKWHTLSAGESAAVPPGVRHTFRNPADVVTRVHNTHEPALNIGSYFETIHHIVESGAVRKDRMTVKALLYLSTVMVRFTNEIVSTSPPHVVVVASDRIARLLGFTADNAMRKISNK